MSAFAYHFAFEFRTGVRNRNLLLMNYLFPLGLYLMMSLIMPEVNPLFRDTIIPAMITFGILAAALLGLPDPVVQAREAGIFRSYKINGVPASSILLVPVLSTILHIFVVATIITVSAPIFFDAPPPVNGLLLALVVLATAVAVSGLGILIGVIAPNSRLTVLYTQAIFLPSMIIGSVMLPYDLLPEAAATASLLLPSTHAMNAFSSLAMGQTANFSAWSSVLTLFAGGLFALLLARVLFRWDNQNTDRRGHPALALLTFAPYVVSLVLLRI